MFQVRVLTPAYLLSGEVEETNAFLGWLNNKDKNTLDLHNVESLLLDPNTTVPATSADVVTVAKAQIVGMDMYSAQAQQVVNVPDRTELAVLYTGRFIIQANLHPTGDMPINRIPNAMQSNFVAVTAAKLHPLLPTRQLPSEESPLLLLNWRFIDFYHAR